MVVCSCVNGSSYSVILFLTFIVLNGVRFRVSVLLPSSQLLIKARLLLVGLSLSVGFF